jgi:hypothetical protein
MGKFTTALSLQNRESRGSMPTLSGRDIPGVFDREGGAVSLGPLSLSFYGLEHGGLLSIFQIFVQKKSGSFIFFGSKSRSFFKWSAPNKK